MASVVTICTDALLRLGDRPINTLDEQTDRARLCSNLFAQARDFVIRRHLWNSCIKRVALAPLAAAPAFEWDFQFLLPADCLRVLSLGENRTFTDYRVEGSESGRVILCDENPLYLRYVWRNEDPATWDPGLIEAVTARMTVLLAYPITKSAAVRDAMESSSEREQKVSRAIDGQEDVTDESVSSTFIGVRA